MKQINIDVSIIEKKSFYQYAKTNWRTTACTVEYEVQSNHFRADIMKSEENEINNGISHFSV